MDITRAITVNRQPQDLYEYWHDFANLPRFMEHLMKVETTGPGRSHWTAKAPAGQTVEWEAEIVDDQPHSLIAWHSLPGSSVNNAGSVRFSQAPGDRGTEVRVELHYDPPGGALGATIAKLFGEEPGQQIADDLRHFKQVMETGEITQSDASVKGRGSAQPSAQTAETASSARR